MNHIDNPFPENWKELQLGVNRIFIELGLESHEGFATKTPRGTVELDIYAVDQGSLDKISYVVECKNWNSRIPQSVVHSFTTVMHEVGANIGFIIFQHGLQSGALEYIQSANIIGLTYESFQQRYFPEWWKRHFVTTIGNIAGPLAEYVELFNISRDKEVEKLPPESKK